MPCRALGRPPPKIHWYKDDEVVRTDTGDRISIASNGTLSIKNLRASDAGIYRCVASSEAGNTSWTASLSVNPEARSRAGIASDASMLPEHPSKPRIINATGNAVTLTWSPGDEGASKIIDYTLEYFATNPKTGWIVAGDAITDDVYTVSGTQALHQPN